MPRMQKANPCLKCSFILFSVLVGIAGCLLFILALMASNYNHEIGDVASGLVWIYVMAVACIILSFLGIFGAYKENSVALRMCLIEMLGGAVTLFILGNKVSQFAPQLQVKDMQEIKPTLMNNDKFIAELRILEMQNECCGLEGYTDYSSLGLKVPNSCECSSEDTSRCITIRTSSSNSYGSRTLDDTQPKHVYKQPCGPILLKAINDASRPVLGFIYGFAATAILGVLLSMSLLCQIADYCEPAATPVRRSNDLVSVPNNAVPNLYEPMINAVPMSYYPLNKGMSA